LSSIYQCENFLIFLKQAIGLENFFTLKMQVRVLKILHPENASTVALKMQAQGLEILNPEVHRA
jgi:hypothetical protein